MLKTHTVSARPLEHLYLAGDKLVKMRRTGCATAEGLHEQTARRATVRAKTARGIEPYIAKVIRGITAEQRSLKSARRGITQYLGGARAPDQDVANGEAAMGDGQHSATSLRLTRSRKDTAEEDGDLREKEYVKREHNVLSAHPDHWASVDRAESDDDTDLVPALGDSPPTSPNRFIIRLAPSYSVPPNTPSLAPLETSIAFSPCPLQLDLLEPAYAAPVIAGPSACSVTIAWPIHPSSPHADMTRMGVRDVVTADRYMREDMPVADNVRAQLRAGWGRKVAEVQAWLDGMDRRYEWDEWHSAPLSSQHCHSIESCEDNISPPVLITAHSDHPPITDTHDTHISTPLWRSARCTVHTSTEKSHDGWTIASVDNANPSLGEVLADYELPHEHVPDGLDPGALDDYIAADDDSTRHHFAPIPTVSMMSRRKRSLSLPVTP